MGSTPIRFRQETHGQARPATAPRAVAAPVLAGFFPSRPPATRPGVLMPARGTPHTPPADTPPDPYTPDPPTSGPHLPYIAPWGVHTRPIPTPLQVHNLEDGGVLVQYNCECPELVEKLRAIVRRYDRHVILAPYPPMKSRIVLTAWTRLDAFEEPDE